VAAAEATRHSFLFPLTGIASKRFVPRFCELFIWFCSLPDKHYVRCRSGRPQEGTEHMKQALLIAVATALTFGAVTASFAQVRMHHRYYNSLNYSHHRNAPRENDSGYSGPSAR
jgi:hypothetical protein